MKSPQAASTERKRLLFLINDPDFFTSHRLPLAIGAIEAGYEVWLASPPGKTVGRLEDLGIQHAEFSLERASMNPLSEVAVLAAIRKVISRLQPDVLHAITMKPVLYGGMIGRAMRVPVTVTAISGLGYMFLAEGLKAALLRKGLMAAFRYALGGDRNRVVFQNASDRDLFVRSGTVKSSQVRMIPGSGTDLSSFHPGAEVEGTPLVLLPARMLWDKGVREFVEAAKTLRHRGHEARFILSGKADKHNPAAVSQAQLEAWNEEQSVEWIGHTSDIANLMARSHIIVLPSYREGFSKSLIDAAAAGRAVITTDVPGCRDAIEEGVTGLLVPPKDSRSLADAIEELLLDPAKRRAMGRAGRALAEAKFSIEDVVARHLAIYAEP